MSDVSHSPNAPPSPRSAAATSQLQYAHLPLFTREPERPLTYRRWLGLVIVAAALLFVLSAVHALTASGAHGLLPMGLGRLVNEAARRGWAIAPFLSAIEDLHVALGLAVFGAALAFGATPSPTALRGEILVFLRRADPRPSLPPLVLGVAITATGTWLALTGHPILGGLIEAPGLSGVAWSLWRLIPESRMTLAVFTDRDLGFANRLEIVGGFLNREGRVTITHDQLRQARVVEPLWLRILGTCQLRLDHVDGAGQFDQIVVPGAGPSREIALLAGFLNGSFRRGLPREALHQAARPWGVVETLRRY